MERATTAVARLFAGGGGDRRGRFARIVVMGLLVALLVPMFMMATSTSASAEDDPDDYSLYQLASNASSYFGQKSSPDDGGGVDDNWNDVVGSAADGGSMLGYADPEFSVFHAISWFFAEVSGSSQTVTYDTFASVGKADGDTAKYKGMLDYAQFGAANHDLGLDSMSSGIGGDIVTAIGGSLIWMAYALAMAVSSLFSIVIKILQATNPFSWFYKAVSGLADRGSSDTTSAYQHKLANGMTGGDSSGGALDGLQTWIAGWYNTLVDLSWGALVPLFIGFFLLGLVLFKKMDRGSALKKLIVRIVFIGVGLPLIGSMYTGVLNKFDDNLASNHTGPTRVVLSNYVDFNAWMMNSRLTVPDEATISWEGDRAGSDALMSARHSALAINAQSHPKVYNDLHVGDAGDDAESAWKNGTTNVSDDDGLSNDFKAVFSTFGIIAQYTSGQEMAASDFESGIKTSVTNLGVDSKLKKAWFVDDNTYGDVERFGEEDPPVPNDHPILATQNRKGLQASSDDGVKTFTTSDPGTMSHCHFKVWEDNGPAACNLAPLAAYNYLNTGFGSDSMTMFSSNNATSGFTRSNHMAVSQVGSGLSKFMYWSNTFVILGCIALLGFWYAIGMLVGAIKRTFSLVAAIPFATVGAIAGISKVIVYTVALILEVIVSLFIYQFVSQFLVSIPEIMSGPVAKYFGHGVFGNVMLGGIAVVIFTLLSNLLILGVTIALLRVRKVVLQAMDEVFTKLVDKFLDTNTAPKPDKGGMLPAMASGVGAGAGMAAGNKMAGKFGGGKSGGDSPKAPTGNGQGQAQQTNAGGLNGQSQLTASSPKGEIEGGSGDGGGDDGGNDGPGGGDSQSLHSSGTSDKEAMQGLPGGQGSDGSKGDPGKGDDPKDDGGQLQLSNGKAGSSKSDKETAKNVSSQGGLTNLGYGKGQGKSRPEASGGMVDQKGITATNSLSGKQSGQTGKNGTPTGGGRSPQTGRGGQSGQGGQTQFGTGAKGQGSQKFAKNASGGSKPAQSTSSAPGTKPTRAKQVPTAPKQASASKQAPTTQSAPRQAPGRVAKQPQAPATRPAQAPRQQPQAPAPRTSPQSALKPPAQRPAPAPRQPRQAPQAPAQPQAPQRPNRTPDPKPQSDSPVSYRKPGGGRHGGSKQ